MSRPEVRRSAAGVKLRQRDVGGYRPLRPELAADDRPDARLLVVRAERRVEPGLWEVPGEDVVVGRAVVGVVVAERPDQRELVGLPAHLREQVAHLDAG